MTGPCGGQPASLKETHPDYPKRGLTIRILSSIFEGLSRQPAAEVTWKVVMTITELYKEMLKDLLSESNEDLRIREDRATGRGVYIEGIREVEVRSVSEAVGVLMKGMERKQVAATAVNETSSRSHTLVSMYVTQVYHVNGDTKTVGRLNLVDLAGSERVEKTGAEGDRLKEAQTINLSLTLLGNVINRLTDGKSLHIPYRDSKLTRILQDSFGGNSRTTLFCNCSPSPCSQSETLSTLLFANRAKQIKNKPRINKELAGQELRVAYQKVQEELELLRAKIGYYEELTPRGTLRPSPSLRRSSVSTIIPVESADEEVRELRETLKSIMKELEETKEELEEKVVEVSKKDERAAFYEKREADALGKAQEWKGRYEREKLAADSWMRKYNEKVKELEKEKTPATPPAKPKPKPKGRSPSITRRASSGLGGRKTSGQSVAAAPSAADSGNEKDALMRAVHDAKENEAAALVKEREVREIYENLMEQHEVEVAMRKGLEKKLAEGVRAIAVLDAELEKNQLLYEAKLAKQDEEMARVMSRYADKDFAPLNAKMEFENSLLYEQNNENAQRLVDLTRDKDSLERQLRAMKEEKERLHHQITLANISADLKSRLLGDKLRATKMAFQQRLLDCFSDPHP
eukprot:TRINITY_DN8059_c0_g1_i1.p1 TRINITY_DN8059_c0_g1~~TRINITY_DN8059_c0_g1_i1.p1  ORF type:complete len:736 (+),score=159.08 TRINITY_DN8059_c0_g1_i1:312-2210(+)